MLFFFFRVFRFLYFYCWMLVVSIILVVPFLACIFWCSAGILDSASTAVVRGIFFVVLVSIHPFCNAWLMICYSDHSPVYAAFKLGMRLPLSIINIPGELPRGRSAREGLLLFSKVSAKINLTRSGIASPSSPGSGQRGTIEDELLRSPPGTTSDGDWNPYIKFVAPFIAQDRKYKTSILKRVSAFFW